MSKDFENLKPVYAWQLLKSFFIFRVNWWFQLQACAYEIYEDSINVYIIINNAFYCHHPFNI